MSKKSSTDSASSTIDRYAWKSRFGFYIASIGTAFGLGNLWRFPYVSIEYGGGAFVFLYIIIAFFVGIPLVIAEVSMGKYLAKKGMRLIDFKNSLDGDLKKAFGVLLYIPPLIAFVVLSYYAIISGWTLHMITQILRSFVRETDFYGEISFLNLKKSFSMQALLASVHLILVFSIVYKGFRKGIEKWLVFVMPFFLILLLYSSFRILAKDDLFESFKYMIYPNFHMLNAESVSYALGHVLFTMSVGFGTLVALGAYLPNNSSTESAGVRIAVIDTSVSILIGIIIYPIVLNSNYDGTMSEILFRAVPNFMHDQEISPLVCLAFFICIFIASINASIGLVETLVLKLKNSLNYDRSKSSVVLYFAVLFSSILMLFISFFTRDISLLIEKIDDVMINHILPLSAIALSLIALKFVDESFLKSEFHYDERQENKKIYYAWRYFLIYLMPLIYISSIIIRNI